MNLDKVLKKLQAHADTGSIKSLSRVGINNIPALGVRLPVLRSMAKDLKQNHALALVLWGHPLRETHILATLIADPLQTDAILMDAWAATFYNWEVCDQCCMNLFEKTPYAYHKALSWCHSEETFIKRAGFVLMARLAVSDKKANNHYFELFMDEITRGSMDTRPMVKKAVNWALRQIGKRNACLNRKARHLAENLIRLKSGASFWVGSDALKELSSAAVQKRLGICP